MGGGRGDELQCAQPSLRKGTPLALLTCAVACTGDGDWNCDEMSLAWRDQSVGSTIHLVVAWRDASGNEPGLYISTGSMSGLTPTFTAAVWLGSCDSRPVVSFVGGGVAILAWQPPASGSGGMMGMPSSTPGVDNARAVMWRVEDESPSFVASVLLGSGSFTLGMRNLAVGYDSHTQHVVIAGKGDAGGVLVRAKFIVNESTVLLLPSPNVTHQPSWDGMGNCRLSFDSSWPPGSFALLFHDNGAPGGVTGVLELDPSLLSTHAPIASPTIACPNCYVPENLQALKSALFAYEGDATSGLATYGAVDTWLVGGLDTFNQAFANLASFDEAPAGTWRRQPTWA